MKKYATYCGLYCGACIGRILSEQKEGDSTSLHLKNEDNDTPCSGCGSSELSDCEFVQCNKNHGTECCAFCPEFPCSLLIKFLDEWEHHKDVIDNLRRIKEIGMENWLKEQKEIWKCRSCGSRTKWYQKRCSVCNSNL
jgi:hypothetical protein